MINRAYIEVMTAGDAKGRVFTFPIPTYNITPDFDWEHPNAELLFEMTAKYGLPYFQNFLNSELKPNMIRSMCCRLQLDLRELLKRGNGLFGSAEQTGSLGVVTINCARLGYLLRRRRDRRCSRALDELLELAQGQPRDQAQGHPALHRRRAVPLHQALPRHAAQPLLDDRRQRHQRDDPQLHARRARHHRRPRATRSRCACSTTCARRSSRFQEETGHLYNLEATPAEGTTYRFAKEDRKRFPDILQAGTRGDAVLHELVAAAGRLHRRPVRGARAAGGAADASTPAAPCCTST